MSDSLTTRTALIAGHNGDDVEAYLVEPTEAASSRGGVVVIHHMPGYDRSTKEIARRFGELGYNVVMPNLYWREAPGAAPDDAAAAGRAQGGVPDERLVGDVGGAAAYLRDAAELERQGRRDRLLLGWAPERARGLQPRLRRRRRLLRRAVIRHAPGHRRRART